MSETVKDGKVVSFSYTLKNNQGEQLEQSPEGQPLEYIHGNQNIIPGLERELEGLQVGDTKNVNVKAAEAYGEYNDQMVFNVPKERLPQDVEIQPGMQFQAESEQGVMMLTVKEIKGEEVVLDANHPMAGQELNFEVKIDSIREATEQEKSHGHVHQGGHDH